MDDSLSFGGGGDIAKDEEAEDMKEEDMWNITLYLPDGKIRTWIGVTEVEIDSDTGEMSFAYNDKGVTLSPSCMYICEDC